MHAEYSAVLERPGPVSPARLLRFAAEFLADVAYEKGPWPRLLALWSDARGLTDHEARELRRLVLHRGCR